MSNGKEGCPRARVALIEELIIHVEPRLNSDQQNLEASIGLQTLPIEGNEQHASNYRAPWKQWFKEVDQFEPVPYRAEPDEYGRALIEKFKHQGLEL